MVSNCIARVVRVSIMSHHWVRQLEQALLLLIKRPTLFTNRHDNVSFTTHQWASLYRHTGGRVHGRPVSTPVNDNVARRMC